MSTYILKEAKVLHQKNNTASEAKTVFALMNLNLGALLSVVILLFTACQRMAWADELISVNASAIHPTQPAIGFAEVRYSLARYRAEPRTLFNDFCKDNGAGKLVSFDAQSTLVNPGSFRCSAKRGSNPQAVKSAVLAPNGAVYLTDGHHSLAAYRASTPADFSVLLRITDDLRYLPSMDAFWDYLQQHRLVWLTGMQGKVAAHDLPQQVGIQTMQDDPYRSLLYFLRDVAYDRPQSPPPFLEFYLGAWLQSQLAITAADTSTQQAYFTLLQRAATRLTQAPPDTHSLPDTTSPTLKQLGQLTEVNVEKLRKLDKPDGKLAHLFSTE